MGSSSSAQAPLEPLPEELRERRLRWLLGGIGLLLLLALIGILTSKPLGRAISHWHSNRLADQALARLQEEDYPAAAPKIRGALQFDFRNPKAQLAAARYLSHTGQAANALEWWQRLSADTGLTAADRRDYATAAIAKGALEKADEQIQILRKGETPPFP